MRQLHLLQASSSFDTHRTDTMVLHFDDTEQSFVSSNRSETLGSESMSQVLGSAKLRADELISFLENALLNMKA